MDNINFKIYDDLEFRHKIICWIAEYSYCKANDYPVGDGHTPPSIIYEQVEKDFTKFLEQV